MPTLPRASATPRFRYVFLSHCSSTAHEPFPSNALKLVVHHFTTMPARFPTTETAVCCHCTPSEPNISNRNTVHRTHHTLCVNIARQIHSCMALQQPGVQAQNHEGLPQTPRLVSQSSDKWARNVCTYTTSLHHVSKTCNWGRQACNKLSLSCSWLIVKSVTNSTCHVVGSVLNHR